MTLRRAAFRRRRVAAEGAEAAIVAAWLADGDEDPWIALLPGHAPQARRAWEAAQATIMSRWLVEHPGTRPRGWWLFEAPSRLRARVGGTGDAVTYDDRDDGNDVPLWRDFGVPQYWPSPVQAAYRGGVAIDPADPPLFESQAAYLIRHGLLTPAERARLTDADFRPEAARVKADR